MNYSLTKMSAVSVVVPRYSIACTVVDATDQSKVLADYTGANALLFPNALAGMSQSDRDEFIDLVASWIIHKHAGL